MSGIHNLQKALTATLERANAAIALDDMEAAAAALSEARVLAPDHAGTRKAYVQAQANLSSRRLKAGDPDGARKAAESALALDAKHLDALINLGSALLELKFPEQALSLYERALAQAPFDAGIKALRSRARLELSVALEYRNEHKAAREIAKLESSTAFSLRALALPYVVQSDTELTQARKTYEQGLDALLDAPSPVHLGELAHCNFLLAYQAKDDLILQKRYGSWLCRMSERFQPKRAKSVPRRIGIISSFLRTCTVGSYFASWVDALRAANFDVEMFQLGSADAFTDQLIAKASSGAVLKGSLELIASSIAERRLDIVIYPELGMDARTMALASLQLGRVQLCAWGHPVTTGMPSIDGYFSCAEMEPPEVLSGRVKHYSETLIALPGLGTRYARPTTPPNKSPSALHLPLGARVLIAQSPYKLLPQNDRRLTSLAHAAPSAQFVLFETLNPGPTAAIQMRLRKAFVDQDLNPARLHWLALTTREEFLQINAACDVAIDSYGFSGGNTSLDALLSGLPLFTVPSELMRGRQSSAMLNALGLDAHICAEENIADRAAEFLNNRDLKRQYRQQLATSLEDYLTQDQALQTLVAAIEGYCD
jgi:predicted O-linked N-acetylglucosamine transferase (SPINDLY family)